ncbi:VOC family protein [Marinobacter salsuginis]|uniref:VOC family protein n=1 Tax=Marinobacter salsuginis TaxID=418719 RepID=UPI001D18A9F1|nr:VOC family protein [Marinobacter salsuginis]
MKETGKINYVEIPARDLEATKRFFGEAFGWTFVDYGPEYVAIENAGLDGGFFKSDIVAKTDTGSVLVVLFSTDLEVTLEKVELSGGKIVKDIFPFPGGRRFHFSDQMAMNMPSGQSHMHNHRRPGDAFPIAASPPFQSHTCCGR